MRRPKQVELSEVEKKAMKESHKFALAISQPRRQQQTEAAKFAQSVKPKTNEGTAKPRSKEMEEFLSSIGETKTLHANLHAKTSTRAKEMFDKMKETRRAKHIEALNEYESWIETFGESMKERYEDRKSQSNSLRDTTGAEVERTLADMTDQTLLASDLEYVTYAWDHVAEIRKERKQEIGLLGNSLRELHRVKKNSIIEYITNLKAKLIDIAFLLEPQIVGIIQEILDKQQKELEEEGKEIDTYLADVSEREQKLFEEYYKRWKEKKERFHLLKQNEAIENFKKRLNEKYFVNPEERVTKMKQLMDYQLKVYNSRKSILAELQAIPISEITKEKVNDLDEKLKKINEDASDEYKKFFQACIKIQEERHKEALALVEYLKGFLVKNDAELPEGKTFDMIIAEECSPLVELRLKESKELLLHIDKYLEEFESRMHEYSKNIISFYRFIGENYDQNRKDTQNLELQFELSIAKLADQNEENMNKRDAELKSYVDSLKKSVTQITLVERVEKCYNMLDTMNKEYDAYEKELKELVSTQEPKVVKHYQSFELKLAQHFKMDTLDKKDAIQERLAKETEEKQKKMEEEYMKKKEQEELLAAQQNPPAGAKGASPVKGKPAATDKSKGKGKGQAEPNPDLPKLEVPKVQEYVSPSGETYAVDYPLEYLAESLMRTEEEIEYERLEEEKRIEEKKREEAEAAAADPKAKGKPAAAKKGKVETKKEELAKKLEEEEKIRKEQEEKEMQRKAEAEEKERLRANVPKDPEKNQCLHDGLLISKQEIVSILSEALQKVMGQIGEMRQRYIETLREKNEETITKNMKDVDTLFQKPWPEEESIEVDVFQTRQSEIVNHKKIYDKHVRSVLKKNDADDRLFDSIVKEFKTMLNNYEQLLGKYMNALGNFSNLAELQGYLRKTKEAYNILTEQINKYRDDFKRLYTVEIDTLLKLNRNFVNSCTLQVNGGTYSEDEKEYYDTLIKYIDAKFVQCKENRQKTTLDLMQDAEKRRDEPYNAFEAKYAEANTNLAAKEGLGKVFGKPKRMLQDQLKAEMSKCDEAQNGINELMGKLKGMLEEYNKNAGSYFANRKPVTLSLDIRKTLIALRNCIVKYAEYLGAFKEGFTPDPLPRITSNESKEGIELSEEEQKVDAEAKLEEIRALGTIGYQAGTAKDVVFVTALEGIENNIKEAARKLYQGDNAQYLQGPDKIPEYLENYLKATHGQADEFKIGCIRALRTSSNGLAQLAEKLPEAIYGSIEKSAIERIVQETTSIETQYDKKYKANEQEKKQNLLDLRPNLSNPACKDELAELDKKAMDRFNSFVGLVDATQFKLLKSIQSHANVYFKTLLNTTQAGLAIYSSLLFNDDFILLPGDDISEKKHLNIKNLMVQREKEGGYVEKTNRGTIQKWKGLPKTAFDIDFTSRPEYKKAESEEKKQEAEYTEQLESIKTAYHKALIKQRDESFKRFSTCFNERMNKYFTVYDNHRNAEYKFKESWVKNVAVLKAKQDIKS